MALFISCLNSFTNSLLLYLLSLTALLNSYINSSIIFSPYSNLFSSAIFTAFLSPPPNFFLMFAKNFPTISYSSNPPSRSFSIFSFQMLANPLCIYNNIHCICSSTATPLIFIFNYNLHTVMKPEIFSGILSNTCSLATSILTSLLPLYATSKA